MTIIVLTENVTPIHFLDIQHYIHTHGGKLAIISLVTLTFLYSGFPIMYTNVNIG